MKQITKTANDRIHALLFVISLLFYGSVQAQEPIAFFADVIPNSDQTVFTVIVGDQQLSVPELQNLLRPGGGSVLRVTSIQALIFDPPAAPSNSDYALVALIASSKFGDTRGFGAGTISATGGTTTQINFEPGLVIRLESSEKLTLRSFLQSNATARIELHGFLEAG